MNNACPSCGAVYAVTAKDIGRKIKCKKCSTGLRVDDTGLVVDTPTASAPPAPGSAPVAAAVIEDEGDGDVVVGRKGKKAGRAYTPGGGDFLAKIGGVPTILFGVGTFFVLYFFFQPVISQSSASRAEGAHDRVKLERDIEIRKITEGKDLESLSPEARMDFEKEAAKKTKEINKKFEKPLNEASDDKEYAKIGAKRSPWMDNFGLMVGFILLAFGCIGYVRSDTHLLIRIVGGAILTLMMMAVFGKFSGCGR